MNQSSDVNNDKVYRGLTGYKNYIEKKESQVGLNKITGTHGPVRAPLFIRMSNRFDYQPDICKDYKETGYCGFGDNCKFLHDRGDYKAGWQIEKEWQEEQKKKQEALQGKVVEEGEDEYFVGDEDEDELPFACHICREEFTNPVITKCEHYFCEACALKHYSKSSRCAVCKEQTFGVFNVAHKLLRRIEQRKKEERQESSEESEEQEQEDKEKSSENDRQSGWTVVL